MVARAANLPQGGRRAGTGHQRRRWKSRSTNVQSAEAYPCVLAGLVPANYVASTSPPAENMNHQRDQGKDQKQMNQKARDMVHDIASNPSKNQQHSDTKPNEPTHKLPHPWAGAFRMDRFLLSFNQRSGRECDTGSLDIMMSHMRAS